MYKSIIWRIKLDLKLISNDTTLEAARIYYSILRNIGHVKRVNMALELSDELRETIESGIRKRNPDYDDKKVRLSAFRLVIGEHLFDKAYSNITENR